MDAPLDHRLAAITTKQHGVLSRAQAIEAGLTAAGIRRRVMRGLYEPVHPNVYRLAGAPQSWEQGLAAATLVVGGGVVSHRSAAALWGVQLPIDIPIEVSVRRGRRGALPGVRGVVLHRSLDLDDTDIVERAGLPTTTPARLLLDLGAIGHDWMVERAMEQLLLRGLTTVAELEFELRRRSKKGRRGCGALRRTLAERGLGARRPQSILESKMANILRGSGLPMPDYQYPVVLAGRQRLIDFAYVDLRIAVEVDGYEVHSRRDTFQEDRVRANDLELAGWLVLRFTWHDVVRRPSHVLATIRRAIELRTQTSFLA